MRDDTKKVIISSTSEKSINRVLNRNLGKSKWVYLGEDIVTANKIQKKMKHNEKIDSGKILEKISKSLRGKYIEYIGKLSVRKNSMDWWSRVLSEKNIYISKTFLYACYLKIFYELIRKEDETIVFFVENDSVKKTIVENSKKNNLKIIEIPEENMFLSKMDDILNFITNRSIFLINNIYRIILSKYVFRMHEKIKTNLPLTLIHTFVTGRSFDNEGRFKESYFGELYEKLIERNINTANGVSIWGTSYYETIKNLKQSEKSFLVPHAFLSISDILDVFIKTFKKQKKEEYPLFEGLDISELIYSDLKKEWNTRRVPSNLLFYYLIKRLKNKNIPLNRLIYTYENNTWEKILLMSMRKFYPSVKIISYQHAALSDMHLNYFFSGNEKMIIPLPDYIITSGEYYETKLKENNYPKNRIIKGGAIRYKNIRKLESENKNKNEKPRILVTASISEDEATELIWKVYQAFSEKKQYEVIVKCHPYLPFNKISRLLDIETPSNFIISDKSVPELLKESDVLIYTSSTTCVESIAIGKPVVHVQSDLYVNLDILKDFGKDIKFSARSPKDILDMIKKAIEIDHEELMRKKKKWKKTVNKLFEKVDDSTYLLFIK